MLRISEIITSPVISLYESEFQGIVYNAVFDFSRKKCKYLCVLQEEEGLQKMLDAKDIYLVGNECVFIKNDSILELGCNLDSKSQYINPLNLQVYNMDGKLLGTSTDVLVDNKLNILSIELNNGNNIPIKNIINLGKNIILVNDKAVNISRFKPKKVNLLKDTTIENKVTILSHTPTFETKPQSINIEKIITDYRFLVGRTLLKNIIALNGEIIAKSGTTITKDIVNRASLYGKLVEITRYSKKTNQ